MILSLRVDTSNNALADSHALNAVLGDLLPHSIRLRDLYKGARRQILSDHAHFPGLRRVLAAHYQEQLLLIDNIVGRMAELGGAVSVFASGFLREEHCCRLLRGPQALDKLLKDFLEGHEAVLSAISTDQSENDSRCSRDCTVAEVRLVNQRQYDLVNAMLSRRGSPKS